MPEEIVEIKDLTRAPDGSMKATVRYASGLEVTRGVKSVSLEAQITRADGTVEPQILLSKTTNNVFTNQLLQEEGVGKVNVPECE